MEYIFNIFLYQPTENQKQIYCQPNDLKDLLTTKFGLALDEGLQMTQSECQNAKNNIQLSIYPLHFLRILPKFDNL